MDSDNSNAAIKITNVETYTTDNDVANKAYVDSVANGLFVKDSVRAITTTNGPLGSGFKNGSVIDDITLVTGTVFLLRINLLEATTVTLPPPGHLIRTVL